MDTKEQNQPDNDTLWGVFVNKLSPLNILIFLGLLIMFGILLGGVATLGLNSIYDIPLKEAMDSLGEKNERSKRQFIRVALMINHLFLFLLPSLFISLVLFRRFWYRFLNLVALPTKQLITNALAGIILILSSMPFIQYVFYLNKNYIPLPDWARNLEDNTNEMIKNLLVVEAPWELIMNVLTIAIIPALGEEFLFRGIIQKQLSRIFNKHHIAIWLAAAIFSLTHMQLEGFFPRLILGAVLGYLFFWSKSLWIPIIVHFVYNAMQVIALQFVPDQLVSLEKTTETPVPIIGAIISLLIVISISLFIKNYNRNLELAN